MVLGFSGWESWNLSFRAHAPLIYTESSAHLRLFARAEVAELADAQASGACGRKVVEVQILSSAPAFAPLDHESFG